MEMILRKPFSIFLFLIFLFSIELSAQKLDTPLEKCDFTKVTSHQELLHYLKELDKNSDSISVDTIGRSVQGRIIPVVHFTRKGNDEKIKVLVFCQQHGNEPSGKEAALLLIKELVYNTEKDLCNNLDLYIVPSVNPDGNEAAKRNNANGEDLNRNHLILTEPEVIALHKIFNELMPEVTLDVHEYSAFRKSFLKVGYVRATAEQFGAPTNLNISKNIIDLGLDSLFPYLDSKLNDEGVSFSNYYKMNYPTDTVRSSTTAINDGRQSFAILNNFSFILEGRNGISFNSDLKRRTTDQLSAIKAFLEFANTRSSEIMTMVHRERGKIKSETDDVIIQMDYVCNGKTIQLPVQTLPSLKDTTTEMLFSPHVNPIKSIKRPLGYIIPKEQKKLIALLGRHNIEYAVINDSESKQVEVYTIKNVQTQWLENKSFKIATVSKHSKEYKCKKGDVYIPLNQIHGTMLCIALEPESMWGVVQFEQYENLLKAREEFPIYRVISN